MATLFDPISTALETVKTIDGVGSHKPDPVRFRIRIPENPGPWALRMAYQRDHNLLKWSKFRPRRVSRADVTQKHRIRLPSLISKSTHTSIAEDEEREEPVLTKEPSFQETRKSSEDQIDVPDILSITVEEDEYADYVDDDEDDEEYEIRSRYTTNQTRYWRACVKFQVPVNRRVLRSIDSYELQLKMMKMTDNEFKAIMASMVGNDMIERLDLTEVRLSDLQVVYLTDFFSEESGVTDLILAENALKGRILHRWFDILTNKDNLVYLDVSGNDLRDRDMAILFDYLAASQHLTFLYMSRNNLTEAAGDIMGKMLAENTSVVDLDISQNRIRGVGTEKFMKGLAKNSSLERLDFSWNGLGKDGTKAVANVLKKNTTLIYLDISGTRINGACMELMFPALKKNTSLQRIMLKHNPLLMSDISRFLTELYKWQSTGIMRIDFGAYQTVEESIIPLIDLLFWEKNIDIRYGTTLVHSDRKVKSEDVITQFRNDPLALVTRLRNDERLKLVKYFGKLDLEEAIESGIDEIGAESFLNKMRSNRITYKDLANRIKRAGNNPIDVIYNALEMADIINPRAPLVPRYSLRPDVARRLYIKSRNEGGF